MLGINKNSYNYVFKKHTDLWCRKFIGRGRGGGRGFVSSTRITHLKSSWISLVKMTTKNRSIKNQTRLQKHAPKNLKIDTKSSGDLLPIPLLTPPTTNSVPSLLIDQHEIKEKERSLMLPAPKCGDSWHPALSTFEGQCSKTPLSCRQK